MWPHIYAPYVLEQLDALDKPRRAQCGEAELLMVEAQDFFHMAYRLLEQRDEKALKPLCTKGRSSFEWLEDIDNL